MLYLKENYEKSNIKLNAEDQKANFYLIYFLFDIVRKQKLNYIILSYFSLRKISYVLRGMKLCDFNKLRRRVVIFLAAIQFNFLDLLIKIYNFIPLEM